MQLRTLEAADLEQAWALDADAFHVPADRREAFLRWTDPARHVGVFDAGRLVALTGAHALGQFFGRRSVPMGGLASVSVAPEYRGRGLARRVISAVVEAMRERGEVISTLFPATTRLYRGLGWELGGNHQVRKIPPRALQALPPADAGQARAGRADDAASLRACYARFAREHNGFLDRPERWWQRRADAREPDRLFVVDDAAGGISGYLLYRQLDGELSHLGGPFQLRVEELVANRRDAALALWRLLGSWTSQAELVHYRGAAEDPLLLLLPEQESEVLAGVRWMTRMVDVEGAVAARGYAPGLELEVELELRDALVAANSGRFVLSLAKGSGQLVPGGGGALRLDVGAFASLYTGWASCAVLERAGRLEGGSPEQRAALDAAFAGPAPWMLDEF